MLVINNPGNIRLSKVKYAGELSPSVDPYFKQFVSMPYGYRAMFVLLQSYAKHGYNTIAKIINRYAPDNENNTAAYIDYVSKKVLHKNPDEIIDVNDKQTAIKLVYAISKMENGTKPDMNEIKKGWKLAGKTSDQPRFKETNFLIVTVWGLSLFFFYKILQHGTDA